MFYRPCAAVWNEKYLLKHVKIYTKDINLKLKCINAAIHYMETEKPKINCLIRT